ncbi:hypothetical protein EC991_004502 [Linnemannia zychae]|nr:hypothetical protein EC991_004502 [Linnemannia zychae]
MPCSTVLQEELPPQYSPYKPQRILRLTTLNLGHFMESIQESEHFRPKGRARPQAPVKTWLMVAMYRLERVAISTWFKHEKGFPNATGAVDGVPFSFESAPHYDTASWNTRKFVHIMGCTTVCGHQDCFTYDFTWHIGSPYNSSPYRDIYPYTMKDEFFQEKVYTLGDAAYAMFATAIPR